MRLRRTGSPDQTRPPGAPKSPSLESLREQIGSRVSERTIARIARAQALLRAAGVSYDEVWGLIQSATQPNGSINASCFEEAAEWRTMPAEQREMILSLSSSR
jgi:hypothetical protein